MFTGGMYPVTDMTAGEKERKTMEALLSSPATRREIVLGKNLAAMTAIFITAVLTLGSMVYSLKGLKSKSPRLSGDDGHHPSRCPCSRVDRHNADSSGHVRPLSNDRHRDLCPQLQGGAEVSGAALAGSNFPRSDGRSVWLRDDSIPIFNVSQIIRSVLLGEASATNFAITTAANLTYASIAFVIATKQFENENVLFRS
jgi:sodium transport system permease protein